MSATDTCMLNHVTRFETSRNVNLDTRYVCAFVDTGCGRGGGRQTKQRLSVEAHVIRVSCWHTLNNTDWNVLLLCISFKTYTWSGIFITKDGRYTFHFYLFIYWIQRYTMTSFFYVVSSACNTSFPAFRKCMDASIKKFFWLRVQPLVHRLLDLFVWPQRLASHRLFERPKHIKITGGEVWRVHSL
jgi:hypothetical protein